LELIGIFTVHLIRQTAVSCTTSHMPYCCVHVVRVMSFCRQQLPPTFWRYCVAAVQRLKLAYVS